MSLEKAEMLADFIFIQNSGKKFLGCSLKDLL
jgi:hypothetical protein